ncbi:hypothetical protein CDD82_5339 [Ophiocordyceps australis]|uniref:Uncharacterized protein n=1 Tax=Ophiocordyceps australis TaxID=1399860 RepID=A0A2C5Z381_9HYPO|nr:hypothetical protein CDD82_5339 [Ophiocordyceps australis]
MSKTPSKPHEELKLTSEIPSVQKPSTRVSSSAQPKFSSNSSAEQPKSSSISIPTEPSSKVTVKQSKPSSKGSHQQSKQSQSPPKQSTALSESSLQQPKLSFQTYPVYSNSSTKAPPPQSESLVGSPGKPNSSSSPSTEISLPSNVQSKSATVIGPWSKPLSEHQLQSKPSFEPPSAQPRPSSPSLTEMSAVSETQSYPATKSEWPVQVSKEQQLPSNPSSVKLNSLSKSLTKASVPYEASLKPFPEHPLPSMASSEAPSIQQKHPSEAPFVQMKPSFTSLPKTLESEPSPKNPAAPVEYISSSKSSDENFEISKTSSNTLPLQPKSSAKPSTIEPALPNTAPSPPQPLSNPLATVLASESQLYSLGEVKSSNSQMLTKSASQNFEEFVPSSTTLWPSKSSNSISEPTLILMSKPSLRAPLPSEEPSLAPLSMQESVEKPSLSMFLSASSSTFVDNESPTKTSLESTPLSPEKEKEPTHFQSSWVKILMKPSTDIASERFSEITPPAKANPASSNPVAQANNSLLPPVVQLSSTSPGLSSNSTLPAKLPTQTSKKGAEVEDSSARFAPKTGSESPKTTSGVGSSIVSSSTKVFVTLPRPKTASKQFGENSTSRYHSPQSTSAKSSAGKPSEKVSKELLSITSFVEAPIKPTSTMVSEGSDSIEYFVGTSLVLTTSWTDSLENTKSGVSPKLSVANPPLSKTSQHGLSEPSTRTLNTITSPAKPESTHSESLGELSLTNSIERVPIRIPAATLTSTQPHQFEPSANPVLEASSRRFKESAVPIRGPVSSVPFTRVSSLPKDGKLQLYLISQI